MKKIAIIGAGAAGMTAAIAAAIASTAAFFNPFFML